MEEVGPTACGDVFGRELGELWELFVYYSQRRGEGIAVDVVG